MLEIFGISPRNVPAVVAVHRTGQHENLPRLADLNLASQVSFVRYRLDGHRSIRGRKRRAHQDRKVTATTASGGIVASTCIVVSRRGAYTTCGMPCRAQAIRQFVQQQVHKSPPSSARGPPDLPPGRCRKHFKYRLPDICHILFQCLPHASLHLRLVTGMSTLQSEN